MQATDVRCDNQSVITPEVDNTFKTQCVCLEGKGIVNTSNTDGACGGSQLQFLLFIYQYNDKVPIDQ